MDALAKIRNDVEEILSSYCDGTWNGLERAHFIEYGNRNDKSLPQDCLDRLVEYIASTIKFYHCGITSAPIQD